MVEENIVDMVNLIPKFCLKIMCIYELQEYINHFLHTHESFTCVNGIILHDIFTGVIWLEKMVAD